VALRWAVNCFLPGVVAQELMVINLTLEHIVTRAAQANLLHWPPPGPSEKQQWEIEPRNTAVIPDWVAETNLTIGAQK